MKFIKGLLRHPIMLTLVICLIGLEIYLAFIQTNTIRNEHKTQTETTHMIKRSPAPPETATQAAATIAPPATAGTQAKPAVTTPPHSASEAKPAAVTSPAATTAPASTMAPAPAAAVTPPATAGTQAKATPAIPQPTQPSESGLKSSALLEQARKAFWSHDYAKAIADYRALIQRQPNRPELYGELGNVLYDSGKRQAAGEQYAKAAELYLQQGNVPAALGLLPIVSELAPKQAEALRQALSDHQRQAFAPPAHEDLHGSETHRATAPQEASLALLVKARQAYWQGDYKQAESDYRKLIAETPDVPMLHGELGNVLYASGNQEAAGKEYAKAAELYLQQGNVLAALGLLPIVSELAPKQATALRQALAEHKATPPTAPKQAESFRKPPTQAQLDLLVKARQAYWQGDYKQAESDYRKLIAETPGIPMLHGELGNVLLAAGQPEAAAKEYLKAGELLIAQGQARMAARLLPTLQRLDPAAARTLAAKLGLGQAGQGSGA